MIRSFLLIALCALSLAAADKSATKVEPLIAWDFAKYASNEAKPTAGHLVLTGPGEINKVDGKVGVRLKGGQYLSGILDVGPIANGGPFALEIDVAPSAAPTAYLAGLIQAGTYMQSGVRILLRQDLCVVVEHFAGTGDDKATYLVGGTPLPIDKFSTVRYEYKDGKARLLVNGLAQETKPCTPSANWTGPFQIGSASGNSYDLDGTVAGVRLYVLTDSKDK